MRMKIPLLEYSTYSFLLPCVCASPSLLALSLSLSFSLPSLPLFVLKTMTVSHYYDPATHEHYEKVPDLKEVSPEDVGGLWKGYEQRRREREVKLAHFRLVEDQLQRCYLRHGVHSYKQHCRKWMEEFRQTKDELLGWKENHRVSGWCGRDGWTVVTTLALGKKYLHRLRSVPSTSHTTTDRCYTATTTTRLRYYSTYYQPPSISL